MNKIVLSAMVGLALLATTANADVNKGKRIYQKKLKSVCGMNGGDFAAKHTVDEWEEAQEDGKLSEVMSEVCPAGKDFFESKKFKSKFAPHLYDFVKEFGEGSGNLPSC